MLASVFVVAVAFTTQRYLIAPSPHFLRRRFEVLFVARITTDNYEESRAVAVGEATAGQASVRVLLTVRGYHPVTLWSTRGK